MTRRKNHLLDWGVGLGIAALVGLFIFYGYENTWRLWNIQTLTPYFADLRTITHAGESYRAGYDPWVENPADPWQRPINYPRLWGVLVWAGMRRQDTLAAGLVVIALFILGIYRIIHSSENNLAAAGLFLAVLFSPAVLTGVERGNNDLVIFFLLAVSVAWLDRAVYAAMAALLAAFALKLYPIFALVGLLQQPRRVVYRLMLVAGAAACLYLAITYPDLALIRRATPQPTRFAYGVDRIWRTAGEHAAAAGPAARGLTFAGLVVGGVVVMAAAGRLRSGLAAQPVQAHNLDLFRVGASIYLGTFLLGGNWNYRLMFLLFTIPQLSAWVFSPERASAYISRLAGGAILAAAWFLKIGPLVEQAPAGRALAFGLEQAALWVIFWCLAVLLLASLPAWATGSMGMIMRHNNNHLTDGNHHAST